MITRENGREIVCRRELRQGDPLSPMLFCLVADGLNKIIHCLKSVGLVEGLRASNIHSVTNLQHADNTLLFKKEKIDQAIITKWALHTFERWSGLKFNYHRSQIHFLGNVNMKSLIIERIFRYKEGKTPIMCLGIPIRSGKLKKVDWMPLFDRVLKKLEEWKGQLLSLRGRITVLNAIISATPFTIYLSQYYPSGYMNGSTESGGNFFGQASERIRRHIIWYHGIKYESAKAGKVCRVKNLHNMNQTLLSRRWWKILSKLQSLVVRILRNKYGSCRRSQSNKYQNVTNLSGFQRGILPMKDKFWHAPTFVDGKSINLWEDNWEGPHGLSHIYSNVHQIINNKDLILRNMYCRGRFRLLVRLHRDIQTRKRHKQLLQRLQHLHINSKTEDSPGLLWHRLDHYNVA